MVIDKREFLIAAIKKQIELLEKLEKESRELNKQIEDYRITKGHFRSRG